MTLTFPNYDDLVSDPIIKQDQLDIIKTMICDKFTEMNNNPKINRELIEKNLMIVSYPISFYHTKDFASVKCRIVFFDDIFELPVSPYFNANGKCTHWHSYYSGSPRTPDLMNILNINHFNDGNSYLKFALKRDIDDTVYDIIKEDYIKTPKYPENRTTLKYHFDKNHKISYRSVETREVNKSRTTSFSMEGFEKMESEMMFLKFLKHIMAEKENVDSAFIHYSSLNFDDVKWIKTAHSMFFTSLTGEKRTAFLDYMNVVDMMAI